MEKSAIIRMKDIFNYLKQLAKHNNREWFKEHKDEYDSVRVVFEFLVQQFIEELSLFDTSLHGVRAKDCMFRIYRDIRFSHDKTPYKPYFSAWITRTGRKGEYPGYYIHIEPGNVRLSAGIWHPDPKLLKMVRKEIFDFYEDFEEITEDKNFKKLFGQIRGDKLKSIPKGYDKTFKGAEYLKLKDFFLDYPVDDSFFNREDWIMQAAKVMQEAYKFNSFINVAVEEFYERD